MEQVRPRFIAYYLPQFHPIKENDEWWGRGFTEWTNTAKAKPRYPGHYQPHVPADLGFYDLRLPEARAAQAALAREYGIEGFCYYHYWFGNGRRLLEQPLSDMLSSREPDFPFCVCWANDTWTGIWHGAPGRVLIEQDYPGVMDEERHFETLLPAFKDRRYMCAEGRPIYLVWRPFGLPDPGNTVRRWRAMARNAGLDGLFLIGIYRPDGRLPEDVGFDASIFNNNPPVRGWGSWKNPFELGYNRLLRMFGIPTILSYKNAINHFLPTSDFPKTQYPSVIHSWDNTPRSGVNGLVFHGATPELFRGALRKALDMTQHHTGDKRLVFLKSWNEWAEGNHLEPDLRDGHQFLKVIRDELQRTIGTS